MDEITRNSQHILTKLFFNELSTNR